VPVNETQIGHEGDDPHRLPTAGGGEREDFAEEVRMNAPCPAPGQSRERAIMSHARLATRPERPSHRLHDRRLRRRGGQGGGALSLGERRAPGMGLPRGLRRRSERGDCFAMVVLSRKERSGLLAGTVPLRELAG
jgi:hypothetical protein